MQKEAVIVAHGFPSDPGPQDAVMQALAARVSDCLPGWSVRGATLAAPGALNAALNGMDAPLVYPFFMANGWFTGKELPRRIGNREHKQVLPFGLDPHLPDLCEQILRNAIAQRGWNLADTALLLAGHGSQRSTTSADSTHAMADEVAARMGFQEIRCGFVEQAPMLEDAATDIGQAICLPFFALRASHVETDIPEALAKAGFSGALLPPLGEDGGVPQLIANALQRTIAEA